MSRIVFTILKKEIFFLLGPNQPHVFKKSIDDLEENGVQSVSVFFDTNGTLSSIFHTPEFAALLEFVTMSKKRV